MIKKIVQLEFADSRIRAIDHIQDLRKAAEKAGLNLFSRYNVRLQYPMPTPDDRVVVEIDIPDEIAATFAIGNRLRGISQFLLDKMKDSYQPFLVGNRLLHYIEVEAPVQPPMVFSMADRLDAIISFTKLMERSDEEALDQISRILTILKETTN